MNTNYTHQSMLLDRSGSMDKIKTDVIGGFNTFLEEQKKEPGKLTVYLAQFDDFYDVLQDTVDVQSIPNLTEETFKPRGWTALLDSVAKLIIDTGKRLADLPEDERPAKVLITIITDGKENASKQYNRKAIAEMIKHQEEVYKWQFAYIGANQDAFAEASSFGLNHNAVNYSADSIGTRKVFKGMSAKMSMYRSAVVGTDDATFTLSQKDIDDAKIDLKDLKK